MRRRDWERYYARYLPVIRAIARKLARQDDDLAADLEQEASLALWRLDPKRATSNEDSFVRMALRNTMYDFLRKNQPRRYESLDQRLENGDQIERLPDGELRLDSGAPPPLDLYDPDEEPGQPPPPPPPDEEDD